jgi:hypothetical protein
MIQLSEDPDRVVSWADTCGIAMYNDIRRMERIRIGDIRLSFSISYYLQHNLQLVEFFRSSE